MLLRDTCPDNPRRARFTVVAFLPATLNAGCGRLSVAEKLKRRRNPSTFNVYKGLSLLYTRDLLDNTGHHLEL